MVVFQKLEGKTTTLNFWNQKLEGKTTTLKNWIKKMEGNSTTPKNCVLTNFLHERSIIFLLVFSLIRFWILLRNAHCSHLNVYISQKIRLCVVNLEGQFQTSLEAKLINLLIWKFRSIILVFLLFFAGVVKFSAFCTPLMLFPKGWII